jgi:serine/threonine protein kinase
MIEKLGKGSFGDVFLAEEKNIGLLCVIKKILKKKIR